MGLTNFINRSNVDQKNKDIIYDLLTILKGKRQAWARINSTLGESNKKRQASYIKAELCFNSFVF